METKDRKNIILDYVHHKCEWRICDAADRASAISYYDYYDLENAIRDIQRNYPDVESIRINFRKASTTEYLENERRRV